LLGDADQRNELSTAARKWHRTNTGAVERTLAFIRAQSGWT
jgi:hypothetical protein